MEQFTDLIQGENPVKPSYYRRNGLECYDVQQASMGLVKYQGYLEGCAQKYLWRWEQKNDIVFLFKETFKFVGFFILGQFNQNILAASP